MKVIFQRTRVERIRNIKCEFSNQKGTLELCISCARINWKRFGDQEIIAFVKYSNSLILYRDSYPEPRHKMSVEWRISHFIFEATSRDAFYFSESDRKYRMNLIVRWEKMKSTLQSCQVDRWILFFVFACYIMSLVLTYFTSIFVSQRNLQAKVQHNCPKQMLKKICVRGRKPKIFSEKHLFSVSTHKSYLRSK